MQIAAVILLTDLCRTPFLTAYPCEIWPYRLRSHGLTITWITVVVANFFNTFVNPIALESIGWKYYFVFVVVLVIMGLTVYFFYPETRGYTLEHMAVIFDGSDAAPSSAETAQRACSVTEKGEFVGTLHEEKV
jgi:hypothetical protein